jgi:hypothetical protein
MLSGIVLILSIVLGVYCFEFDESFQPTVQKCYHNCIEGSCHYQNCKTARCDGGACRFEDCTDCECRG